MKGKRSVKNGETAFGEMNLKIKAFKVCYRIDKSKHRCSTVTTILRGTVTSRELSLRKQNCIGGIFLIISVL